MAKYIQTKKGLTTLLKKYEEANASEYWLKVIKGCIDSLDTNEPIYMDEIDYDNTPKELRKLWKGLK